MFNSQQGNLTTLNDLSEDFELANELTISKQGLHQRFNERAVDFLNQVLSQMLSHSVSQQGLISQQAAFSSCLVRDSTRFGLPDEYSGVYKGHGGATKTESMISIQYEMDLLSGQQVDLQLTSGCGNDQQDTKESSVDIRPNSLLIRDLGYITSSYLKAVITQKAYFLNLLPSQMQTFDQKKENAQIDFKKVFKKMKRHQLHYMEFEILAGKKAQIPCRMIVHLNDEKTTRHKTKRTAKNTKSIGCKVSKEQKTRAKLSIYITNVAKEVIKPEAVKPLYSLRWQIELVFKTWKSLCKIDKIKKVKLHRFQCMLIAGFIWILAHWKIFQLVGKWLDQASNKTCSVWKFFKHMVKYNQTFRGVIFGGHDPQMQLYQLLTMAPRKFYREAKKGQLSYPKVLKIIKNP